MTFADERPLVLTLQLDEPTQRRFDRERAALFPAGRTVIGAHVTLFHALPGEHVEEVAATVVAAADRRPFPLRVTGVVGLGRGVAYRLDAPELLDLHRTIQQRWWDELSPQDRQPYRPHITVQNKVDPDTARQTLALLRSDFVAITASAEGLQLWRYDGGPWQPVMAAPFGTPTTDAPT